MNPDQKAIEHALSELPDNIQQAIKRFDWGAEILHIGNEYQLQIDEVSEFRDETMRVIVGLSDADDYARNLSRSMGVPMKLAESLVGEANTRIFIELQRRAFGRDDNPDMAREEYRDDPYGDVDPYAAEQIDHDDLMSSFKDEGLEIVHDEPHAIPEIFKEQQSKTPINQIPDLQPNQSSSVDEIGVSVSRSTPPEIQGDTSSEAQSASKPESPSLSEEIASVLPDIEGDTAPVSGDLNILDEEDNTTDELAALAEQLSQPITIEQKGADNESQNSTATDSVVSPPQEQAQELAAVVTAGDKDTSAPGTKLSDEIKTETLQPTTSQTPTSIEPNIGVVGESSQHTSAMNPYHEPIEDRDLRGILQHEVDTGILHKKDNPSPDQALVIPLSDDHTGDSAQELLDSLSDLGGTLKKQSLEHHLTTEPFVSKHDRIDLSPSEQEQIRDEKKVLDDLKQELETHAQKSPASDTTNSTALESVTSEDDQNQTSDPSPTSKEQKEQVITL